MGIIYTRFTRDLLQLPFEAQRKKPDGSRVAMIHAALVSPGFSLTVSKGGVTGDCE
jgi:hypothetical protein